MSKSFKSLFIPLYLSAVVVFCTWYISDNFALLSDYILNVNLLFLTIAFLSLLVFYFIFFLVYKKIQSSSESPENLNMTDLQWGLAFIFGYVGRYIPGKIAIFIGRINFLSKLGFSKKSIVIATLYENLLTVISALAIGTPVLFLMGKEGDLTVEMLWIAGFLLIAMVFLLSPLFERMFFIFLRLLKKEAPVESIFLKSNEVMSSFLLMSVSFVFMGVAFFFFCKSIAGANLEINMFNMFYISASYLFAGAIGILALFAPSGIGVREGVVFFLLAQRPNIMPEESVLLAVISFRFLLIVVEFSTLSILWYINKQKSFPKY